MFCMRAVLFVVIFGTMLLFGYLIALNHEMSWDLGRAQEDTLDAKTRNIAKSLSFDVRITAFCSLGEMQEDARNLLELYKNESLHISHEIIDVDANPAMVREHGINRYGQASLGGRGREIVIDTISEEEITNALLRLQRERKKIVYALSGHGEPDIFDKERGGLTQFVAAIEQDGYGMSKLFLMQQGTVPQDADLLIIPGPRSDLFPEETEAIHKYIESGGNVLIALEPRSDGGLRNLLGGFGVILDNAMITDPSTRVLGSDSNVLVVSSYGGLKELDKFSYVTIFPTSRPLIIKKKLPRDVVISWLARTSDQSMIKSENGFRADRIGSASDPSLAGGPFDISLFIRKIVNEQTEAGIILFGDVDFLTNAYFSVSGNKDLAMNCVNVLLDEGNLIAIDSKKIKDRPFILTQRLSMILFLISVITVPSLILSPVLFLKWKRNRT